MPADRDLEHDNGAAVVNIGTRLRAARVESGYSLRELARQLSVSPSLLSQIENGKSQPSVATLYLLAQALSVSVDHLFQTGTAADGASHTGTGTDMRGGLGKQLSVTVPGDRSRLVMDSGVTWEQLAENTSDQVEFVEMTYPAGSSSTSDGRLLRHDGFEYGYLLEGELEVTVGTEVFTLLPGHAVGIDSSVPHVFRNRTTSPARGIWFVHHQGPSIPPLAGTSPG